jgi:protein TonB
MERPLHELAAFAHRGKKDRTMSVGIVAGIHVVIIAGLIAGLAGPHIIDRVPILTIAVVPKKDFAQEPPPKAPPVQKAKVEAPPTLPPIIIAPPRQPPSIPDGGLPVIRPPLPPTAPREIAQTHTLPPYPPLSQRLGEQGTTGLSCEIGADGKPIACSVTRSSGSARLDDSASSHVKGHWTWQPATRDGKPVADKIQLNVVWDLKNAS